MSVPTVCGGLGAQPREKLHFSYKMIIFIQNDAVYWALRLGLLAGCRFYIRNQLLFEAKKTLTIFIKNDTVYWALRLGPLAGCSFQPSYEHKVRFHHVFPRSKLRHNRVSLYMFVPSRQNLNVRNCRCLRRATQDQNDCSDYTCIKSRKSKSSTF